MTTGQPPARTRSLRGERRRQLLLDGAADVALEQGFAAVSHRAVAQRAGLPLAATTYYFASGEELLAEALDQLAQRWLAAAKATVAGLPPRLSSPTELVDALLAVVVAAPAPGQWPVETALLTSYERYLEAARHPRLRPVVAAYGEQLDALLVEVLSRRGGPATPPVARLVLAAVDGSLLRSLAEGTNPIVAAGATVEQLLGSLSPSAADWCP